MPEGPIERELANLRQLAARGDHTAKVCVRVFDAMRREQAGGITARFASTANRASLSGLANTGLDGTPVEGDVVLLKDQTDAKQNGIWKASSGNWSRVTDDDGDYVMGPNMLVAVREGSTLADKIYQVTSNSTVVDTDNIVFAEVGTGGGGGAGVNTGMERVTGNGVNLSLSVYHSELEPTATTTILPDGTVDGQEKSISNAIDVANNVQLTVRCNFYREYDSNYENVDPAILLLGTKAFVKLKWMVGVQTAGGPENLWVIIGSSGTPDIATVPRIQLYNGATPS